MTRAEAAQICQSVKFILENSDYTEAVEEALDMAIEALEQETVSRETYTHEYYLRKDFEMKVFELEKKIAEQEPNEDCISRQAAIDADRMFEREVEG